MGCISRMTRVGREAPALTWRRLMQACDVPMQKLRVTRSGNTVGGHPYLRLLRAYLEEFLPREHAQGASPIPAAGAAHNDALPRSAQSAAAACPL